MDVMNLPAEPLGNLYSWLPHGLEADKDVFLPDACPGESPLPTGTAVLTRQANRRRFAASDCGCGMRLVRTSLRPEELNLEAWDAVADRLRQNKGGLGDLGGDNHLLDVLAPYTDQHLYLLIHTGSRAEPGHVDALVDTPARFDAEFQRVVEWAAANRAAVQDTAEAVLGPMELVLDLPHNTYEILEEGGAIIRKGPVRVELGQLSILPSRLGDDVLLVRATERVNETLLSLSHGTGRAQSRGDSKVLAREFDFAVLRKRVLIPDSVSDALLRTEGPYAYRSLEDCLALTGDHVELVERSEVVAYMGRL